MSHLCLFYEQATFTVVWIISLTFKLKQCTNQKASLSNLTKQEFLKMTGLSTNQTEPTHFTVVLNLIRCASILTINNKHEKITRFWLAESSAVQV